MLQQDLGSTERLLVLHGEAVARGLAPAGERGVLELVSLAEHARRYGTTNPPGLFAKLLRDQKWHFITQDDEELARARFRAHRGESERNSQRASSGGATPRALTLPGRVGEVLGRVTTNVTSHPGAAHGAGAVGKPNDTTADALFASRLVRTLAARGVSFR